MPDNKNLLNLDDLADVFAQLNDIEDAPEELTEEEKASQRRYEEIIKKPKIGLAPKSIDYLHQALDRKEVTTLDQIELGLVKDVNGKVHDIFRNRIMFL